MNEYLNELYTHPVWTVSLVIFLWRMILSFYYSESGREGVIAITALLLLVVASPVFIDVPEIENKMMYAIMYLLVYPLVAARVVYFYCFLIRSNRNAPPYPAIAISLIVASIGVITFIGGLVKLLS